MKKEQKRVPGRERRKYFRIVYQTGKRPILKIKSQQFQIIDISRNGLRLLDESGFEKDDDPIKFRAIFLDGESFDLEGYVVWQKRDEFGLKLKTFFPTGRIEREKGFAH